MATNYASLNDTAVTIDNSKDNVVIVQNFTSLPGGRTLDTTGFAPTVIKAGHLIIRETSTGNYKPMPVSGSAYAALPASHTYAGFNVSTILTAKPFAGIMTRGTVNDLASPYTISGVLAAVKTALPLIYFVTDNQ